MADYYNLVLSTFLHRTFTVQQLIKMVILIIFIHGYMYIFTFFIHLKVFTVICFSALEEELNE
jgi:hypothetical protein